MKKPHATRRILLVSAAAVLAASALLRAAALTWDGGGGSLGNDQTLWNDVANWSPNGVPNLTTDVTFASGFASGHTILIGSQSSVNSLTINTTTGFNLQGSFANPNSYLEIASGDVTRNDV